MQSTGEWVFVGVCDDAVSIFIMQTVSSRLVLENTNIKEFCA